MTQNVYVLRFLGVVVLMLVVLGFGWHFGGDGNGNFNVDSTVLAPELDKQVLRVGESSPVTCSTTTEVLLRFARDQQWMRTKLRVFCATPPLVELRSMVPDGKTLKETPCYKQYSKEIDDEALMDRPYISKFADEITIPSALRHSRYLAPSPFSEGGADFVFVEECITGRGQQGQFVPRLIMQLEHSEDNKLTWAENRTRHIVTLTGDHGPCQLFREHAGGNAFYAHRETPWLHSHLRDMVVLQHEGSLANGCYHAEKDVVIPTPVISTTTPSLSCEGAISNNRDHLVFLGGRSSSKIRQRIAKLFQDDPDVYSPTTRLNHSAYMCEMASATFCLAPRGQASWSPRLEESIHAGCIPVIISDDYAPPFSFLVDYTAFSVTVPQVELANLKTILLNISQSKVNEMLQAVRQVRPLFRYTRFEKPHEGDDALDAIMFQLWLLHVDRTWKPSQSIAKL
eukprot:m.6661 g.6661  ORF g.6661 m.6661 type:complete len:455 (+) comp5180_c0_seq2:136-1500(+)